MVDWNKFFLIQNSFFGIRQRGGSKCSSSPRFSASKTKEIQIEIDIDVWSRLPRGATIQIMNPLRVGLAFIDGSFGVYLGLRFFGGSV